MVHFRSGHKGSCRDKELGSRGFLGRDLLFEVVIEAQPYRLCLMSRDEEGFRDRVG